MNKKVIKFPVRPERAKDRSGVSIKYKITVSYDGTNYHGWQAQPKTITIAGTLQHTFAKIFGAQITILGASRTDAGVHARGQVAMFCADISLPPDRIVFAWNNMLPDDILITSLEIADSDFFPLYNVKQKTYCYTVHTQRPSPFAVRYGWYYYRNINPDRLRAALNQFVGTHDFRAFCTIENVIIENTIRTVDSIAVFYDTESCAYRIEVKGEKFLRYMIRRMVGAAVKVAADETIPVDIIRATLEKKDPSHELPNAPACGLTLMNIEYVNKG